MKHNMDGTKVTSIAVARTQMKQCGNLKRLKKFGDRNIYRAKFDSSGYDYRGLDDGYLVEDVEVWETDGGIAMIFKLNNSRR